MVGQKGHEGNFWGEGNGWRFVLTCIHLSELTEWCI